MIQPGYALCRCPSQKHTRKRFNVPLSDTLSLGVHRNNTHESDSTYHSQHHRHLPIQPIPLSWVDWKKLHRQRYSTAYSSCTHSCGLIPHTRSPHLSNDFAPLATPVESSEIRATYAARPSNIVRHDGKGQAFDPTVTPPSPRVAAISG